VANIKFEFEYDLPDEYLSQQATKGLKAKGIYEGPAQIWVLVDNNTGALNLAMHYVEVDPRDPEFARQVAVSKAGLHSTAVLVDAKTEPVVASFFVDLHEDTYTDKEYALDDGTVHYVRPDPTYPDHTYEVAKVNYDIAGQKWNKPFPWKEPHVTAEQHETARLMIIEGYKRDLADPYNEYSEEVVAKINDVIKELEAIPDTHGHLDPWMIPFPNDPRAEAFTPAEVHDGTPPAPPAAVNAQPKAPAPGDKNPRL